MESKIYNQLGVAVGQTELPERIFNLPFKPNLVQQVLLAHLGNRRAAIAHTKGRGEVRGGGKKPWRQKGTGRARHASIRSPIWKGGGVAFGPTKERNFKKKINKTMKRQALFMVLSSKVKDKEFLVLEDLRFANLKTKEAISFFKQITPRLTGYRQNKQGSDSILLITPAADRGIVRTINNLPFASVKPANSLNIKEILENKYLIMLQGAVKIIEQTYKI